MASGMDTKANVVAKLARFLRVNGSGITEGTAKLSLTTSVLSLVNSVFVDLLVHDRFDGNNPEDQATEECIEDAKYLLDFVKKTKFLKLFHGVQTLRGGVDVSYFKGLTALEFKKISAHLIVGLQTLPRLRSLTCSRSLSSLKELLGPYSDDGRTVEVWAELKELNVSHNHLENLESLQYVPNVEIIDASHNNLRRVYELMVLNSLVILKVNYNMLHTIPLLSQYSSLSLKILLMKNNNIEDLEGLECLVNLEELDVSNNCISEYNALRPLQALKFLKLLHIHDNPVAAGKQFHEKMCVFLNKDAISRSVIVNGKRLSHKDTQPQTARECSMVDYASRQQTSIVAVMEDKNIGAHVHQPLRQIRHASTYEKAETVIKHSLHHKVIQDSSPSSHGDSSEEVMYSSGKKNKKLNKKVREAIIVPQAISSASESASDSAEIKKDLTDSIPKHIKTKQIIETRRRDYGTEWLIQSNSFSDLLHVENKVSTHKSSGNVSEEFSTSIESEEAKINDFHTVSSMHPATGDFENKGSDDTSAVSLRKLNTSDDIQILNESSDDQVYYSIIVASEKLDLDVYKKQEAKVESEEDGLEEDVILSDSEEENEDNIFIVERRDHHIHYPVFLCIGKKFLKEKIFKTGKLHDVIDLKSLISVKINEVPWKDGIKFQIILILDTLKASKNRVYICDEAQYAKNIAHILQPYVEAKAFQDAIVGALQCLRCHSQFSRSLAHVEVHQKKVKPVHASESYEAMTGDAEEIDVCPNCGSQFVIELDVVPFPSLSAGSSAVRPELMPKQPTEAGTSPSVGQLSSILFSMMKNPKQKQTLPVTSTLESSEKQDEDLVDTPLEKSSLYCTAHSFMADSDTNDNLCEDASQKLSENSSDVTIPSQSSIVVISSDSEGDTSVDVMHERKAVSSPDGISAPQQSHLISNSASLDIEIIPPSQSGSPLGQLNKSDDHYYDCRESLSQQGEGGVSTDSLAEILHMLSQKDMDSSDNFVNVGHRLKLKIEFSILGKEEELDACIKADIIHPCTSSEFKGLWVFSSKQVHILKFVKENTDCFEESVQKLFSVSLVQLKAIRLLPGCQGLAALFSTDNVFYFLIQDSSYCNSFISFIKNTLTKRLPKSNRPAFEICDIDELEMSRVMQHFLNSTTSLEYEEKIILYLFLFWSDDLAGDSKCQRVALIITSCYLFVADVSFSRYFTRKSSTKENILSYSPLTCQRVTDIIEIKISPSLTNAILSFLDDKGKETFWKITSDRSSLFSIVNAVKQPWEAVFDVSLPVSMRNDQKIAAAFQC